MAVARPAALGPPLAPISDLPDASLHIQIDVGALETPSQETITAPAAKPVEDVSKPGVLRYGGNAIRLPFDETNDAYAFGPMRLKRELVDKIVRASYVAGVDPRLLMAIADKESSFVVRARASTSSATGLFQFIDAPWLKAVRDFGGQFALESEALAAASVIETRNEDASSRSRGQVLSLRNDPFVSTLLAAAMLRHEQEKLEIKIGRPLTDGEVYLVHFLGPAGAGKFLSALEENPGAAASQLLPAAARANRPIFFERRWVSAKSAVKASSKKSARRASATKSKLVAQSLSVAQVHGKIGDSLERRLARYRLLDFAAPVVESSRSKDSGFLARADF